MESNLRVYNTLTKQKEPFRTVVPAYQCPSDVGGVVTAAGYDPFAISNYAACFSPDGTIG